MLTHPQLNLVAAFGLCLAVAAAAPVAAQEKSPPPNARETASRSPAPSTDKTPQERARILSEQLKAALNQDPEELARMARDVSASVSAALEFDCELAELEQRETLLEERQEKLQASRDAGRAAAEKLRADLETQRDALRRRFGDSSSPEAQTLHARLAQHYAVQIKRHLDQAEQCENEVRKINASLAIVRKRITGQQLSRELMVQTGKSLVAGAGRDLADRELEFDLDLGLDGLDGLDELELAVPAKLPEEPAAAEVK